MPAKPVTPTNPIPQNSRTAIQAAIDKIAAKQQRIQIFNNYFEGNHPLNFSSEKFTTEFAERLKKFSDNLCPLVVKAPADRLEVIGFANDQNSDLYKQTWAIWKYSKMPQIAKRIHKDTFKVSDAYAIVWNDDAGRARIYRQEPAQCTVFYDSETQTVESGAKLWRGNDNFVYLTLYFKDRIEKYISKSTQSTGNIPQKADAYKIREVDGEAFPLANDTGVCPMFHFGSERSILTDVIPLQDALNKSICDMLVSSESNSIRQRWASGIAFEVNPETGEQVIPWQSGARWVASNDAAAKFGQFTDVNLKDFLAQIEDFRMEVATVTGIPAYYLRIEGTFPSGEALRKAESRFTALISDAQLDFGETWAQLMRFALTIDGTNTPANISTGSDDNSEIETRWKPADPLSANEQADLSNKKKAFGVSNEKLQSENGYTDAEIAEMKTQNAESAAAAADAFSKTFNAGPQLG